MNALNGHEKDAATIENPFIKPQNKSWDLRTPSSLDRSVSPPPRTRVKEEANITKTTTPKTVAPIKSEIAAVEAGEVQIADHVSFFSTKLLAASLPALVNQPRLAHQAWLELYRRNLNERGRHFVVHQHDHPIAGTHYDLRLQCNATSSISFAIMYGLPGDPNSRRLNRNATETRVHNLWNHLIETASSDTGTMLLWDTGEYSVLPYTAKHLSSRSDSSTDPSDSDSETQQDPKDGESEPTKLHRAFQARKIKLRLHGTKLPPNYTISLRLTSDNFRSTQPPPPSFKRRRQNNNSAAARKRRKVETSDSSRSPSPEQTNDENPSEQQRSPRSPNLKQSVSSLHRLASPPARKRHFEAVVDEKEGGEQNQSSDSTLPPRTSSAGPQPLQKPIPGPAVDPDEQIRLQNAYPGATNSINSIHQRKWFLSLDRTASGFTRVRDTKTGAQTWRSGSDAVRKFHVLGRDHETSVLTGRKAADVARDEGLKGYRPRGGWVGITE